MSYLVLFIHSDEMDAHSKTVSFTGQSLNKLLISLLKHLQVPLEDSTSVPIEMLSLYLQNKCSEFAQEYVASLVEQQESDVLEEELANTEARLRQEQKKLKDLARSIRREEKKSSAMEGEKQKLLTDSRAAKEQEKLLKADLKKHVSETASVVETCMRWLQVMRESEEEDQKLDKKARDMQNKVGV